MGNRNQITISYIVVFTVVLSSIVYYFSSFEEKVAVCGTPDVIDYEYPKLSKKERKGRNLYKALCASCHKIERNLVGPALGNIKMDSIILYKHLTKKDTLKIKPHKPYFLQLSIQNTNDIFDYIKR